MTLGGLGEPHRMAGSPFKALWAAEVREKDAREGLPKQQQVATLCTARGQPPRGSVLPTPPPQMTSEPRLDKPEQRTQPSFAQDPEHRAEIRHGCRFRGTGFEATWYGSNRK